MVQEIYVERFIRSDWTARFGDMSDVQVGYTVNVTFGVIKRYCWRHVSGAGNTLERFIRSDSNIASGDMLVVNGGHT